jgi:uncharacterized protein
MNTHTNNQYKGYATSAFISRTFLSNVFIWMGTGLGLTSLISYLIASNPSMLSIFATEQGLTLSGYIAMFSPILFVLLMSFGFNRLSYTALIALFIIYAGVMGISLSFIFLIYTSESIFSTFLSSSLMFGGMGLIGYFTKSDLTRFGNLLLMGLVGIILASLINLFMHSDTFSYVISLISVIIFCGLTAYDVQKLKNLAEQGGSDEEIKNKLGILGALTLYLDFINIFLSSLRLFGKRK